MEEKNILFVCKYNQTRSQMSKALFQKINKNKKFKADSAGVIKAIGSKDLIKNLNSFFKNNSLKREKSKQLSINLLDKQDIIIIVADDVPKSLFNCQKSKGIKIIKWKIKDQHEYKDKTYEKRLKKVYLEIENRMKRLMTSLK